MSAATSSAALASVNASATLPPPRRSPRGPALRGAPSGRGAWRRLPRPSTTAAALAAAAAVGEGEGPGSDDNAAASARAAAAAVLASGRSKRRTNGRGGLQVDNGLARTVDAPEKTIAKIRIFEYQLLGFSVSDRADMRALLRDTIKMSGLVPGISFTKQSEESLVTAVLYMERREPRLAPCKNSWGACSLLSRGMSYRMTPYDVSGSPAAVRHSPMVRVGATAPSRHVEPGRGGGAAGSGEGAGGLSVDVGGAGAMASMPCGRDSGQVGAAAGMGPRVGHWGGGPSGGFVGEADMAPAVEGHRGRGRAAVAGVGQGVRDGRGAGAALPVAVAGRRRGRAGAAAATGGSAVMAAAAAAADAAAQEDFLRSLH